MKKQYIKPETIAYTISTSTILAESNVVYGGSNYGTGVISAESKRRSGNDDFWDEE